MQQETSADELAVLFDRERERLVGLAATWIGCPSAAADLVQEAFVRLLQCRRPVRSVRGCLATTLRHLSIDRARRERRWAALLVPGEPPVEPAAPTANPERIALARERLALLAAAIDELPPRCREVFILRQIEQLDLAEIACRLGISRNMVEKHLRKALLHCRAQVGRSARRAPHRSRAVRSDQQAAAGDAQPLEGTVRIDRLALAAP